MLFRIELSGVGSRPTGPFGFHGDTQISLGAPQWVELLAHLGYSIAPSLENLVGDSLTASEAWGKARQMLAKARRQLGLGDDHAALPSAYQLFDAVARNPYKARWWTTFATPDVPVEKLQAIEELLQAHAQLLNKLGRHPADEVDDEGLREMLPMDH